jgi:hypothetical protein
MRNININIFRDNNKNNYNIDLIYNMPLKMNMFLSNGNPSRAQIVALNVANSAPVPKPKSSALNGPIIGRIHSIKPGCGSCGRH